MAKTRRIVRNMTNKCARKFDHVWAEEPVKQTRTHNVKRCERCHGLNWVPRRDT